MREPRREGEPHPAPAPGGQTAPMLERFSGLSGNEQKSVVSSVVKALALLQCFSPERAGWTLAELAAATALNKTACHRLASTLERAGWLRRPPAARTVSGSFALGADLLEGRSATL